MGVVLVPEVVTAVSQKCTTTQIMVMSPKVVIQIGSQFALCAPPPPPRLPPRQRLPPWHQRNLSGMMQRHSFNVLTKASLSILEYAIIVKCFASRSGISTIREAVGDPHMR